MAHNSARTLYAVVQTARVAFYGAHYLVARALAQETFSAIEPPAHPMPRLTETLAAMRDLFVQDWENIEAGLYPAPLHLRSEVRAAAASTRFLADMPRVIERQRRNGHGEVRRDGEDLPRYYRRNFHFQTGGYLSEDSAKLYDFQVEALFAGTASAMRRRAFGPLAEFLDGVKSRKPVLLDIGAGTGRFLSFVKSARPKLKVTALDLSKPYLARARRDLAKYKDVQFVAAPAEDMPLPDASIDAAVSVYLFHELPPKVRAAAAREIARVLKPGGLFVLADSIQYGDTPAFDGLIDLFPSLMHEPYYASYAKTDFDALFAAAGLKRAVRDIAYLTKIACFEKPKPKSSRKRRRSIATNSRSRAPGPAKTRVRCR